jgi:hypothetical protein
VGNDRGCVLGCCTGRSVSSVINLIQEFLMDRFDVVMVVSAAVLALMMVLDALGLLA